MWAPVIGTTKFWLWLTLSWTTQLKTNRGRMAYPCHKSVWTVGFCPTNRWFITPFNVRRERFRTISIWYGTWLVEICHSIWCLPFQIPIFHRACRPTPPRRLWLNIDSSNWMVDIWPTTLVGPIKTIYNTGPYYYIPHIPCQFSLSRGLVSELLSPDIWGATRKMSENSESNIRISSEESESSSGMKRNHTLALEVFWKSFHIPFPQPQICDPAKEIACCRMDRSVSLFRLRRSITTSSGIFTIPEPDAVLDDSFPAHYTNTAIPGYCLASIRNRFPENTSSQTILQHVCSIFAVTSSAWLDISLQWFFLSFSDRIQVSLIFWQIQ